MPYETIKDALKDATEALNADDLRTAETCLADALDLLKAHRDAQGDVEN